MRNDSRPGTQEILDKIMLDKISMICSLIEYVSEREKMEHRSPRLWFKSLSGPLCQSTENGKPYKWL